jgi:hypothetical protein
LLNFAKKNDTRFSYWVQLRHAGKVQAFICLVSMLAMPLGSWLPSPATDFGICTIWTIWTCFCHKANLLIEIAFQQVHRETSTFQANKDFAKRVSPSQSPATLQTVAHVF